MTDDERKLLVEISLGLAMLNDKLSSGASMTELGWFTDRYLERTADLTMRVVRGASQSDAAPGGGNA